MTDHETPAPSSRRQFVGVVAANAALLAAGAATAGAQVATLASSTAGTPERTSEGKFDDSWTARLGKHRVVFEVNQFNGAPSYAGDMMDSYQDGIGAAQQDLGFVIVLRHGTVAMTMREEAWQKYPIGEALEYKDRDGKFLTTNTQARMIERLLDRGVIVLACNVGFTGLANRLSRLGKGEPTAIQEELRSAMYPNVYLQPNGVYALLRAQNVGCAHWKVS